MVSLTFQVLLRGLPAPSDHWATRFYCSDTDVCAAGSCAVCGAEAGPVLALCRPEPLGQPLLSATLVPGALFWLQSGHAGLGRPSS